MLRVLPMHVAICALTFCRPDGIRCLLAGLGRLHEPSGATVEVIVVDNDEARSAEAVVQAAAGTIRWPVQYIVEPRRGIAQGRNRAVAAAHAAGADFVAFIDDDEVPSPAWLDELLRVQVATHAGVVTGPVVPVFQEPPPAWVVQGAFFERPRFPTGERLTYARTSNVLIEGSLMRDTATPFDERFGLSGGEDTHFFMRVRLGGAHIVWADGAMVSELVPATRVSVRWLVRRAYRRGNTLSLCLRDLSDSWPRRGRRVAGGILQVALGTVRLASAVAGRARAVAGLAQIAYGVGLVTGLVGVRYEEYRTVHGG
mgnify:CR=1 FL=1